MQLGAVNEKMTTVMGSTARIMAINSRHDMQDRYGCKWHSRRVASHAV